MAKKPNLEETLTTLDEVLKTAGFSGKETETVRAVFEEYRKESEDEKAEWKRKLDEANDRLVRQEAARLSEAASKLEKEKYLADLEKAKEEIRKECEAKACKEADARILAFKDSIEKNSALEMAEKGKKLREQALAESESLVESRIDDIVKATDAELEKKLVEALSLFKGELELDANEKLATFESQILSNLDMIIKTSLQEGLSTHEIKTYVANKVNSDALAAVMEALESKFVSPDTEGAKLLREKDKRIAELTEKLGNEAETNRILRESSEKIAKKNLIDSSLADLPEQVKAKIEKLTETEEFDAALVAVRAISEACGVLAESSRPGLDSLGPVGAPQASGEPEEDSAPSRASELKELERARAINEMFKPNPGEETGIVKEEDDPETEPEPEKPLNEAGRFSNGGYLAAAKEYQRLKALEEYNAKFAKS